MSSTVLIRNATVIDGTGAPARPGDVLVTGDVITAVEAPGSIPDADTVLDATGLTLTPGFVDVHSHVDNAPFLDEDDTAKIMQGVTTEVVGNCGFTLAPRLPATADEHERLIRRVFPPIPWGWSTFGQYLAAADTRGYVTNHAPLVGHNAVRVAVLGMADVTADAEARAAMADLVDEALGAGAFGLSSGLAYPPGMFSIVDEIAALASRLPAGRPYVSHIRGESSQLVASLTEALAVGRAAGRQVQISHLKCAGREQWGTMPAALAVLDRARGKGIDVRQDVYPYTASSTMLTATLPRWFQAGGAPAVLARLADPAALERLRVDLAHSDGTWENPVYGAGWHGVVVASSRTGEFDGRALTEIAELIGGEPLDALVRVLIQEELEVSMIVHSMHEDDLEAVLRHPFTMIGSDGLPPGLGGKPHPRQYGTFPRVLARYSRERGVLGLEEAVRRMTSLPAATYGLTGRGVIAPGMAADLVAFDAATVCDRADYAEPTRPPAGLSWVLLGGEVAVRDGKYLGHRLGRRLTPG